MHILINYLTYLIPKSKTVHYLLIVKQFIYNFLEIVPNTPKKLINKKTYTALQKQIKQLLKIFECYIYVIVLLL